MRIFAHSYRSWPKNESERAGEEGSGAGSRRQWKNSGPHGAVRKVLQVREKFFLKKNIEISTKKSFFFVITTDKETIYQRMLFFFCTLFLDLHYNIVTQ